jgi:hypothetical protein
MTTAALGGQASAKSTNKSNAPKADAKKKKNKKSMGDQKKQKIDEQ